MAPIMTWVKSSSRRLSTRSAITPPTGERKSWGRPRTMLTTPTAVAEPERS
jgi:hypothetical protein